MKITANTTAGKSQKSPGWFYAALALFIIAALCLLIFYGNRKAGFHEDEYYSYYSTNRSLGLYEPDGAWQDRQTVLDEFSVVSGEGFSYSRVREAQSWDVHPPFYYYLLHTVCSLTPGVFSKWQGLFLNMLAFVLNAVLLALTGRCFFRKLDLAAPFPEAGAVILTAFWCLNPAVISGVLFIRMYEWLTVFVLALCLLHLELDFSRPVFSLRFLAGLFLISFLGFMTQYFFVIYLFFTGLFTVLLCLFRKGLSPKQKLFCVLRYAITAAAALVAGVLYYRAALSHIFRGYRGEEAQESFFDLHNLTERLSYFGSLLNTGMFAGFLPVFLILAALCLILSFLLKKKLTGSEKHSLLPVLYLLFTTAASFLTIAKTGLILGASSCRYELMLYGLIVLCLLTPFICLLSRLPDSAFCRTGAALLLAAFMLIDLAGLLQQNVLFLYPEEAQRVAYCREEAARGTPLVILYNPASPENIWRHTDKILCFDRAYYMDITSDTTAEDPVLTGASSLLVLAADTDEKEDPSDRILFKTGSASYIAKVWSKDMWTLYLVIRDPASD